MRVDNNGFRIFTWHIHGTYLYYLSKGNFTIYIPVNGKNTEGYYGRGETFPFGNNVIKRRTRKTFSIRSSIENILEEPWFPSSYIPNT
jgi:hypothetical protein